jgi:hypothetical protein
MPSPIDNSSPGDISIYSSDNAGNIYLGDLAARYQLRRNYATSPVYSPNTRNRLKQVKYNPEELQMQMEEITTRDFISLSNLNYVWIDFLAKYFHGKSNNYIRAFMKRYIVTGENINTEENESMRRIILDIFRRVSKKETLEEAMQFLRDIWEVDVMVDPSDPENLGFLYMFLNTNLLNRDIESGFSYNQKGKIKVSPSRKVKKNKRRTRRGKSPSPSPSPSRSPAIYDGGRKRRTIRRKK